MEGHGLFMAKLNDDGTFAQIRNITADNPWPYPIRSQITEEDGKTRLYMVTRGGGTWRRWLPQMP